MGKPSGENQQLQASQANLANIMASTGQQSAAEGSTLFNLALPGLQQSETYYSKLASGDPAALARANAPAIQGINRTTDSAKKQIVQDQPRGGERNLALEEADLSQGAQVSGLTTSSYVNSFGSLAGLGGQNVSQGTAATATGLQGMNAAANQYGQLQQINAEQKASQLGFFSSLAGAAGEAAGGFCWIAIELYGEDAYETLLIRRYFYDVLRDHIFGQYAFAAYQKYGERWAKYIKTHINSRWITLCVFDSLYHRAQKALPDETRRTLFDRYWSSRKDGSSGRRQSAA